MKTINATGFDTNNGSGDFGKLLDNGYDAIQTNSRTPPETSKTPKGVNLPIDLSKILMQRELDQKGKQIYRISPPRKSTEKKAAKAQSLLKSASTKQGQSPPGVNVKKI